MWQRSALRRRLRRLALQLLLLHHFSAAKMDYVMDGIGFGLGFGLGFGNRGEIVNALDFKIFQR